MAHCLLRSACKHVWRCPDTFRPSWIDGSEAARRLHAPPTRCHASIKLQQVPEGRAEAMFESLRKLCETMALLRQHDLSPELRESVLGTMQGIAEEYSTCLVENLSAAIPPVGFKRAEALQQLKELVWGTCNDGLYTCLFLDEQSVLLARVRPYLTIAEQIELVEAAPEGWRWSVEEVHDAALAYLAHGFIHRQPDDIIKAEQLLVRCSQLYVAGGGSSSGNSSRTPSKALYAERAVCAVLLNRFDKAQKLVKLAGGRVLGQIDGWGVHAATSLFLMCEKWLSQELFPRYPECADTNPAMEHWLRETSPFPFLQGRDPTLLEPSSRGSQLGAALQGVVLGAALMGSLAAAVWRSRDVENPLPQAFASAATLVQIDPQKFSAQLGFSATFATAPRPTDVVSDTPLSQPTPSNTPLAATTPTSATPHPHSSLHKAHLSHPLAGYEQAPGAAGGDVEAAAVAAAAAQLDVKSAESVVQKWQATKALAWNQPHPEQWLLRSCCGSSLVQQTLDSIERDQKSAVYRSIAPQAVKVVSVQPDATSSTTHPSGLTADATGSSRGDNSWLVVALIREIQCEASEQHSGPMVRHQHEYRMQYRFALHGGKWRITEAQLLGNHSDSGAAVHRGVPLL